MKFIAEVEKTITVLRKVIIEAENEKEAEGIMYDAINNSETVEELYNTLKNNKRIIEIKDNHYDNEEVELTYIGEFEEEVNDI